MQKWAIATETRKNAQTAETIPPESLFPIAFIGLIIFPYILAKDRFPSNQFTPLSTEKSRAVRDRMTKNRLIHKYHRVQSAYVHNEDDVKQNAGLLPPVRLFSRILNMFFCLLLVSA